MDSCAVCGSKDKLYYYYPVGSITQGYVLCQEHGKMVNTDTQSLLKLISEATKKGGINAVARHQ